MDTTHDAAHADARTIDVAAVKRLITEFRAQLQTLDCDLLNLYEALDGPPGALAELADKVLDKDWYIDGMDIRDFLPKSVSTLDSADR